MISSRARFKLAAQALCSLGLTVALFVTAHAKSWLGTGRVAPPEVLFFGCKATRATKDGSICMPAAGGSLVFWVGSRPCDEIQILHNGRSLPVTSRTLQEGCQLKTAVLSSSISTSLVIGSRYTGESFWTLQIDRYDPELLEWTQRVQSRPETDLTEIAAELRRKKSSEIKAERLVDYTLASAWAHRRLGQMDLATQEYREVIEIAKRYGLSSIAVDAICRLVHTLRISGYLNEAKETLEEAKPLMTPGHGKERNDWAYHTANILQDEGHLREAAEWFGRVRDDAEKIDLRERMRIATLCLAELFVGLDLIANAQKLLGSFDLLIDGANECEKVNLLSLKAWIDIRVVESENLHGSSSSTSQPRIRQELFDALKAEATCKSNQNLANIYANLAQAALLDNHFAEAQGWVDKAFKVPGLQVRDELSLLTLEGRLALKNGRPKAAMRSFERLDKLSQEHPYGEYRLQQCSSALGMTEALRVLKQPTQALSETVKSCLDNENNTLGPWDLGNLRYRAKKAGIIN